jgi:uncharacterized protein (DUF427 family)
MTLGATCNGVGIAESDPTIALEGRQYFPQRDVDHRYLEPGSHRTTYFWKGQASYFNVVTDDRRGQDAAWFYPAPSAAAQEVTGHIASWNGVVVGDASSPEPARGRWGHLKRLLLP